MAAAAANDRRELQRRDNDGNLPPARSELSASDEKKLERLLQALRLRRMALEPKFSDDVIVWPSRTAEAGGAELAALSAINLGNAADAIGEGVRGRGAPRMKLLKQVEGV